MTDAHVTRSQRLWIRRHWSAIAGLIAVVVVATVVVVAFDRADQPQNARLAVGASAPDGFFTPVGGSPTRLSELRGQAVLLWFVSTSCGSCEAGTQAMATQIDQFASLDVKVLELRLADNLGADGSVIAAFGQALAGDKFTHPNWVWGDASEALTTTYNPRSFLDIYYLLDAKGNIVFYNSSPASTMDSLLSHVRNLGT